MPNIKIELRKDETPEEAEELLLKALTAQRDGTMHKEDFHDPAMRHLVSHLIELHETEYAKMLHEIFEELDKEYLDNGDF